MDLLKNNLESSAEDIAAELQVRLSSCEKIDEFISLFNNTVNISGIILSKECIFYDEDDSNADYKFTIFNSECVSLNTFVDNVICLSVYDIDVSNLEVLNSFEVGDLVGFNGTLTCEHISEDDVKFSFVEERLSLVDVDWSAPYMIHKNFLSKLGISLSDN